MRYPAADYHICPSCGTEFGYDDAGRSHAELRANWLRNGARWWSPVDPQPPNWDPYTQLSGLFFPWLWASQPFASQKSVSALGAPTLLERVNFRINQGPPPDNESGLLGTQPDQGSTQPGFTPQRTAA